VRGEHEVNHSSKPVPVFGSTGYSASFGMTAFVRALNWRAVVSNQRQRRFRIAVTPQAAVRIVTIC
jgi:hypothetical protein